MTIAELIAELQKYPPEAPVFAFTPVEDWDDPAPVFKHGGLGLAVYL